MITDFIEHLKSNLPTSDAMLRQKWANRIISEDIDIIGLSVLLKEDSKITIRFAWLLTEIGEINPEKLHAALPSLLRQSYKINHFKFQESFANYWRFAGVPIEDEANAISLLFEWLNADNTSVTIKSRAVFVLVDLAQKYPELKVELKICLENQIGKYSASYSKRIDNVLRNL